MFVENGGEVVTGIACNDPSFDSCNFNYDIDATGDATTNAVYGAIDYHVNDQLTLDFGVRFENHEVEYSVDEGLDGIVTLAISTDQSEASWTLAGNYALNENMGVFGRINSGSKMPYFDDYRDNRDAFANANNLVVDVDQFEVGFKWVTDTFSLYTTGFYTEVDPSFFVQLAGVTPGVASKNEALGLEIDANYFTETGLTVNLNATFQASEIKGTADDGNDVQRQPNWQFRVSPSYDFTVGDADVTIYGALTAVDDRFNDPGNTVLLDGYEKLDLGAIVTFDNRVSVQIAANNITDKGALTEGDPRTPSAPNGRFILPRSVTFSVGYAF
jgi:outer membrane cobalamin receptor